MENYLKYFATDHRLHDALNSKNIPEIEKLIKSENLKQNTVHENKTILQALDRNTNINQEEKNNIRNILLQSHNPNAPKNYVKPEMFHGTLYSAEIFGSSHLRGVPPEQGKKRGSASLPNQVFFADHHFRVSKPGQLNTDGSLAFGNPETAPNRETIRQSGRDTAKKFAEGGSLNDIFSGISKTNQYKAIINNQNIGQIINESTDTYKVKNAVHGYNAEDYVVQKLKDSLTKIGTGAKKPEELIPSKLELKIENKTIFIDGPEIQRIFESNKSKIKHYLEESAPFLSVINKGNSVPVVLGFEKVNDLQGRHFVKPSINSPFKSGNHPLSGTPESGGRLKEIALKTKEDLTTLILGKIAKRGEFPDGVVARFRADWQGKTKEKAKFSIPLQDAEAELLKEAHAILKRKGEICGNIKNHISALSIQDLQELNDDLRSSQNLHLTYTSNQDSQ